MGDMKPEDVGPASDAMDVLDEAAARMENETNFLRGLLLPPDLLYRLRDALWRCVGLQRSAKKMEEDLERQTRATFENLGTVLGALADGRLEVVHGPTGGGH